jgi:hypothetical protein
MTTELSSEAYQAPTLIEVGDVRSLTQANQKPSHSVDSYFWFIPLGYAS